MSWVTRVLPRLRGLHAAGTVHPHPSTPRHGRRYAAPARTAGSAPTAAVADTAVADTAVADAAALARFRGLWRTASPDRGAQAQAQAHREAFAQLSRAQRRRVLGRLSPDDPEGPWGSRALIEVWPDR